MLKTLAASLFVLLTACGCGGGGGGPTGPAAVALAVPIPTAVALYGDSTQQPAAYSATSAGVEARAVLGALVNIDNQGVAGTNSLDLLSGTDGVHRPWTDEMAASTAREVFINHGINDHTYPVAQYRTNLIALVTIAKAAGKTVILETPNPITTASLDLVAFDQRVAAMRDVGATMGVQVCDVNAAVTAAGRQAETLDGVHPTPALFVFIGQVLAGCIRSTL